MTARRAAPAGAGSVRERLRALAGRGRSLPAGLPLRTRLLAVVVLLLLVAMTVTGVASQQLLRRELLERVDDVLRRDGPRIAVSALQVAGTPAPEQLLPSEFHVQISTPDGQPLGAPYAERLDGVATGPDLPPLTSARVQRLGGVPFTVQDESQHGRRWRVVAYSYTDAPYTVAVALPLGEVDRTVELHRSILLLVGAVVLALGTALAAVAIGRSFRPLREIEHTASAIAAGDLSQRVPPAAPGTEVGRLATALNSMLSQVERSFLARQRSEEQMRRFVADASHELRTPLAAIRGFAELHRMGALAGPADVARAMERIEAESTRLGRLVEDLLVLARLDEAQRRQERRREPVDLVVLASDAVHDARALAPDRRVRLVGLPEGEAVRATTIAGDDAALRQVLTNLVANALQHTPAGTPVEVAVGPVQGPSGPEAVLEVRDHGPGLDPQEAARVFERFYRVDASRQRGTGGGSGLGLAIVATIVSGHGGTVTVVETPGGGATFRVRFVRAAAAVADAGR